MHAGVVSTTLGLPGVPAEAEQLMIARDVLLNRTIGCRYHVQHISTAFSVELIRQAKAAGLPLDLATYDVDVETAGGHVRAARVTLDKLAIGKLVELSVPALVVPRGRLKTNLLGMSFLNRLESWEVRPDKLLLRGYP